MYFLKLIPLHPSSLLRPHLHIFFLWPSTTRATGNPFNISQFSIKSPKSYFYNFFRFNLNDKSKCALFISDIILWALFILLFIICFLGMGFLYFRPQPLLLKHPKWRPKMTAVEGKKDKHLTNQAKILHLKSQTMTTWLLVKASMKIW